MCGIFGIIFKTSQPDLGKILTAAGERLTYRGYDSVGLATFEGDAVEIRKDVGQIEEVARKLKFEEMSGFKGIVQLRWATFGSPRRENAQPHFDCQQRLIGAHNGNIVNTSQLIKSLSRQGHHFMGENDGEVCVHAVEEAYKTTADLGLAIEQANRLLQGDYALCMTEKGSPVMYAVKKYSSLYLGVGENFICCSSDLPSILPLTRKIVTIKDGEYVEFKADDYKIKNLLTGQEIAREPYKSHLDIEQARKGSYPHFMLKEIYEQPEKSKALIDFLRQKENIQPVSCQLKKTSRLFLIGSGSSYHACVFGAFLLNSLARVETVPVIAGAFNEFYRHLDTNKDAFILVSQSGETKDVINVLNHLEKLETQNIVGLVNVLGSSLQLRVKNFLPLLTNLEISVPATKTFLNETIAFLLLANDLAREKGIEVPLASQDINLLPELIAKTLDQSLNLIRRLAARLKGQKHLYYLGYGPSYPVCLEGALKLKEVTYLPCEAIYSSEFKHGPLATISRGDWVILFSTSQDAAMSISHMNEVTCRGGRVALIAPENEALKLNASFIIPLPTDNYYLSPILGAVTAQLLAYELSQKLNLDPDKPRNISKTLTVD
ncbi:MAG: glutamine--fructose-6-phosphate transaminase (isomerizing) [Acidobacteriota bacterium]|nr:glutamine--fructose-6-phosphate transaminase (isomerizing) [Acidobacteriota bacterium]